MITFIVYLITMSVIVNAHKLSSILTTDEIKKLEHVASAYKKGLNILFKIIVVDSDEIYIEVKKGKNINGEVVEDEALIKLTDDLFHPYFTGKTIISHVAQYLIPPVEFVNASWIRKQMKFTGTQLKDLVNDSGLNKSYLSAIINGRKPLSQINKSFFYYYFESKQLQLVYFGRDL